MTVEALSKTSKRVIKRLTLVSLIAAFCGVAPPIYAQDAGDDEVLLEEVIVTGFRKSLQVALDLKRDSVGAVDAIMAEDIADFPDSNLAEALQRIPGVAIARSNGEGTTITVRGLGARYTMTRINGMEARAGTGNNTSRGFSFNMFASELFNSIVVHKTAAAELQEGSLGSIVDLNTAHAFDYQEGTTAVIGGQLGYNDLAEEWDPRFTALYAWHDPSGVWGVTASAAWSQQNSLTTSGNTVGWQTAAFRSVNGANCTANPAACAEVRNAYHARIPRYSANEISRDRLGLTGGIQWAPSDRTLITLDGMYATRDETQDFIPLEVLFRSNERQMDVTSYAIEEFPVRFGMGNNSIISMDVDNAWARSEHFLADWQSTFDQISLFADHEFSDAWSMKFMAGTTNSDDDNPHQTTMMYDDRAYNNYSYDYSQNRKYPTLVFGGADVNNPSTWTLTEMRDNAVRTKSGFDNISLDLDWDFAENYKWSAGYAYKKFTFSTEADRRDGTVCALYPEACAGGTLGPQATDASSVTFTYAGKVGEGSNKTWVAPDINYWVDYFDYFSRPKTVNQGGTQDVNEESSSWWTQLEGMNDFGNMPFMWNAGVRYVTTTQDSSGFVSGTWATVDRPKYSDWLPSVNTALWLTDDLVFRASYAETMSRAELNQLTPGGSVDSFNFIVSFQNPFLDPTRSNNWDFSLEWYFREESVLSFAYFTKDIESFPISGQRIGTYASTGLPLSAIAPTSPASQTPEGVCGDPQGCWTINQLVNGPGAKLNGWEVSFQSPFNILFGADWPVWKNMGIVANYTDVSSNVDYSFFNNLVTASIIGQSDNSYNFTVYYENDRFSTRLSWAHRSEFLENGPNARGNLWQQTQPSTYLDFTSRYIFSDHWDATFEVLNLTDEGVDSIIDVDAVRTNDYYKTGRNFMLGARYKF